MIMKKQKRGGRLLRITFIKKQIGYKEIISVEGNILSKLINLIYLLDYASIYHSVLSETDPSPIDSINFIKEKI